MIVCPAGDNIIFKAHKSFGKCLRVFNDLLRIDFKGRIQGFLKSHRFTCNHVHQRSALNSRNHHRIQKLTHHFGATRFHRFRSKRIFKILAHQNHTAARTSQSLMRRGSNHMTMWNGIIQKFFGNEPCRMSNICKKKSTHGVGDFTKFFIIDISRVSGSSDGDHLRTFFFGKLRTLIIINSTCLGIDAVRDKIIKLS